MTTLTLNTNPAISTKPADLSRALSRQIKKSALRIAKAYNVWEERRALGNLSSEALRDIGITRGDAISETSRSFFDIPSNRS